MFIKLLKFLLAKSRKPVGGLVCSEFIVIDKYGNRYDVMTCTETKHGQYEIII